MFKKVKQIAIVLLFLIAGLGFIASTSSESFKIVKNLDLFFSAFRELNMVYVDTIDADKLVKAGIEGMLRELDPYTDYLPEEDVADFDLATTGEYSGVGALISIKDEYTQITEVYKGFPADKAGLVPGDVLLEIDGQSLKTKKVEEVSAMLRGDKGSVIDARVFKRRIGDTLAIKLTREKVHISGIAYYGFVADSIGYIALTTFSKNCQEDFKKALKELKKTNKLQSLIIDLRGNTGGLVDEAVDIVGMFVPKGTEVVHSRGRVKEFDLSYKTKTEPIDLNIPLAVLVNSSSASASEIVAGALQDLDRAVVVGTRTFGKGLVQSVRPLAYNSKLKVTIAKYYIPSGRCIQAHNFSKRNEDGSVATIPDSLKKEFTTLSGRKVYDGGGVMPDVEIQPLVYSDLAVALIMRSLISEYSIKYFSEHDSIAQPEKFSISDDDYQDFTAFLADKEFTYKTKAEHLIERLEEEVKKGKYADETKNEVDSLKSQISLNKEKDLQLQKTEIVQLINEDIASKYFYQQGRVRVMLTDDEQMNKTLEILQAPEQYAKLLLAEKL